MKLRWAVAVVVFACSVLPAERALSQQLQPSSAKQDKQDVSDEPDAIGAVATVFQPAVLARRGNKPSLIRKGADIRKGDELRTGAGGSLSIVFDDETTFTLTAEATITINEFVYDGGADKNSAVFNVTRGTVSFIAAQVAKSGDMRIVTPTATLGIRGTTGIVEVPLSGPTQVKLYQDAAGTVGRIEMFGRDGARVAELTRASTGFSLQLVGQRLSAAPLTISAGQLQRDRALVQRAATHQNIGRQLNEQRRNLRDPQRRGDRDRRGQGRDNRGRDEQGRGNRDRREQGRDNRGRDEQGRDKRDRREQGRDNRSRDEQGRDKRDRREQGRDDRREQRRDQSIRPPSRDADPSPDRRRPRDSQPSRRLDQQPQPAPQQRDRQRQFQQRQLQQQQRQNRQQPPQKQKPRQQNQVPPR